jgi:hypothetical protein
MPAVLAAKWDDDLPILLDRECDITMPRQLFAAWVPKNGPRAIVRALSADERAKIQARITALEEALKPFMGNDDSTVRASISGLFSGYRSMRQQDEEAEAVVNVTMAVLREFPAWAIAQAFRKIVCGETKLDRRFPPNDTDIFDVVAGVVRPYRENLRQGKALLYAPVDEPPPRNPSPCLAPIRSWPEKSQQRPQIKPMTESRRQALMADLATRRARNDARRDVRAESGEGGLASDQTVPDRNEPRTD